MGGHFCSERKSTPPFQRGFLVSRFFGGCFLPRALVGAFGGGAFCISRSCLSFPSKIAACRSSFAQATNAASGFGFGAMTVVSFLRLFAAPPTLWRCHCNTRSFATPCVACLNKAMVRSLSKRRARHAQCRLQQLRGIFPELPADILDRCDLRRLSYTIKRCGGDQLLLTPAEDGRRGLICLASEPSEQPVSGPSWTGLMAEDGQGLQRRLQ